MTSQSHSFGKQMPLKSLQLRLDRAHAQLTLFGRKLINEWSFTLAAGIAFNLATTIVPIAICVLSAILLIFGNSVSVQTMIRDRLDVDFARQNNSDALDDLFETLGDKSGTVFAINLIIAFFTSLRLLISFDDALTVIYRFRERTVKQQNIHALKMLIIFAVLMPIIIIALIWSSLIITKKDQGYYALAIVVSVIVTFLLFFLIYYYTPSQKMSWKNIWCGTVFLTIGLQILLQLLPLYVRHYLKYYIGQIGFILIILVLFYLCGLFFIIGAQINAFFFDHIPPLPQGLGNCLSQFSHPEHIQLIDKSFDSSDSGATWISGLQPDY